MKRAYFELCFETEVHFGDGTLEETEFTFQADTLFSALYQEALKAGEADAFFQMAEEGDLLFSDAFPYCGKEYYLPKPIFRIQPEGEADPSERKKYKKLQYIPVSAWGEYFSGDLQIENVRTKFGHFDQRTQAFVRSEEETRPYRVGAFRFYESCGLYGILFYETEMAFEMVSKLFELLSYCGIGGKRSSGMGKFELHLKKNLPSDLNRALDNEGERFMLLSCALPDEEEAEAVMEDSSYLLERRSGFVASETYADEWRKKKDLYLFKAGSCFLHPFKGNIYDVSNGGNHPVYRYAKGMFLQI